MPQKYCQNPHPVSSKNTFNLNLDKNIPKIPTEKQPIPAPKSGSINLSSGFKNPIPGKRRMDGFGRQAMKIEVKEIMTPK